MVHVEKWDKKKDGPLSESSLRKKLESQGFFVSRYTYLSGTYFPDHTHIIDKIDAVLSGQFQMTLNGQSLILKEGDSLFVPKGTVHSAQVMGNEPVVSLDATRD